jgi:hypothetical protein
LCINEKTGVSMLGIREGTTIRYESSSGSETSTDGKGWSCVVSEEVSEPDAR